MNARALIWLALAGCGRIAFNPVTDPTGDGGHSTGDGLSAPATVYLVSSLDLNVAELYTLDVATGQLTFVGNLPADQGDIVGLAYWDANTLYAASYSNRTMRITLSPFGTEILTTVSPRFGAIERNGPDLLVVDDDFDSVSELTPGTLLQTVARELIDDVTLITVNADGGDLAIQNDTLWSYWTTATGRLYTVDITTGRATRHGALGGPVMPYIVGIVSIDDVLYGVARDTDMLYTINPSDSSLSNAKQLCVVCPTPFNLEYGDLTKSPEPGD